MHFFELHYLLVWLTGSLPSHTNLCYWKETFTAAETNTGAGAEQLSSAEVLHASSVFVAPGLARGYVQGSVGSDRSLNVHQVQAQILILVGSRPHVWVASAAVRSVSCYWSKIHLRLGFVLFFFSSAQCCVFCICVVRLFIVVVWVYYFALFLGRQAVIHGALLCLAPRKYYAGFSWLLEDILNL